MVEIAFYHLTRSPLEAALPKLLEKTLGLGKRALVLAGSADRVEHLNGVLWTYDPAAWLAHGSAKDGNPKDQPVWLSETAENANGAEFLFLTDGVACANLESYERCFELFDGTNEDSVKAARHRWKAYKDGGHDLTYYQQTDSGGWSKKDT